MLSTLGKLTVVLDLTQCPQVIQSYGTHGRTRLQLSIAEGNPLSGTSQQAFEKLSTATKMQVYELGGGKSVTKSTPLVGQRSLRNG